jgi:biopolymer transport protein TolQ
MLDPQTSEDFDLASALFDASGPMLALEWLLLGASMFVWVAIVIKARQVSRWRRSEAEFETFVARATDLKAVHKRCESDKASIGARVMLAMFRAANHVEYLDAVAEREIERQNVRIHRLMTPLSSIAAAAPLAGLLGTVYGIIDAFLSIGAAKSASLAVVAPAIGEALLTTAVGLFAAIPAVIGYNVLSKALDDLLGGVDTASRVWSARLRMSAKREGE